MKELSGEELKKWINDDLNLKRLYQKLLPSLIHHVRKNGGSDQDAKDLFQDALVILYRKSIETELSISSSIETFVFAIAKRRWLAELRKRRNREKTLTVLEHEENNDIESMVVNHEKQELYMSHFNSLAEGCRKILLLFYKGLRMKEIADLLGFSSAGYARKRKHVCQEKLSQLITADPKFIELANE